MIADVKLVKIPSCFCMLLNSTLNKLEKGCWLKNLDDTMAVVELGIFSIKNIFCMKGEYNNCNGSSLVDKICKVMESCDSSISFYKWATINNHVKKITEQMTGEEMGEMFQEIAYGDKMRMHNYNIYRQYSEMKFLKKM